MRNEPLTLSQAIKQNRLPEFIKQAEEWLAKEGLEHPDARHVEAALQTAIKTKLPADRT
jgi:hypothetical protein